MATTDGGYVGTGGALVPCCQAATGTNIPWPCCNGNHVGTGGRHLVLPRTGATFHFTTGGIPCGQGGDGGQHSAPPRKAWNLLLPQRHRPTLRREHHAYCATNTRASAIAEPARKNDGQASEEPNAGGATYCENLLPRGGCLMLLSQG